jgi:hypothetical protein
MSAGKPQPGTASIQTDRHFLCTKRLQLQSSVKSIKHNSSTNRTTRNHQGESDPFKGRPIIFQKSCIHEGAEQKSREGVSQCHSQLESCLWPDFRHPFKESEEPVFKLLVRMYIPWRQVDTRETDWEILKCYECRKTSTSEEVEIMERDGKNYWVYPHWDFEILIVDEEFSPRKRKH